MKKNTNTDAYFTKYYSNTSNIARICTRNQFNIMMMMIYIQIRQKLDNFLYRKTISQLESINVEKKEKKKCNTYYL